MARKPKSEKGGDDARIRSRAYELWEEEGRPHGRDREHWSQAESEMGLARKKGVAQPSGTDKGEAADDVVAEVPVVKRKRGGAGSASGEGNGSTTRSSSRGTRKGS